jgi:hypothetical protein
MVNQHIALVNLAAHVSLLPSVLACCARLIAWPGSGLRGIRHVIDRNFGHVTSHPLAASQRQRLIDGALDALPVVRRAVL